MTISLERAALRGKLSEAEHNLTALRLRIEGLCVTIRWSLNTALTSLDDLDIPKVASQMDILVETWAQYQKTRIDVERLQKELA